MPELKEWWKHPQIAPLFEQGKATQSQRYGFTGTGVNGIPEPSMRAPGAGNGSYDAHEAEYIMDAQTTQAIGSDVLDALRNAAKTGNLDVNKLREVAKIPPKQGFQAGGLAPTQPMYQQQGMQFDFEKNKYGDTTLPQNRNSTPPSGQTGTPDPNGDWITPKVYPTLFAPLQTEDVNKITINPIGQTQNITPPVITPTPVTNLNKDEVKAPFIPIQKPTPVTDPGMTTKTMTIPPTPPVKTQSELDFDAAQKKLKDVMEGNDPFYQTQKQNLMQDIGGGGAASLAALKQQAMAAGYPAEAVEAMSIGQLRDVTGQAGSALGKLTEAQQQQSINAAQNLAGISLQGMQFGLQKDQFKFETDKYGDAEFQRMYADISTGMSYSALKEKYPNLTEEDYNNIKKKQNVGSTPGGKLMGYLQTTATVAGYDWTKDAQALALLGDAWADFNPNKKFDPNDPECKAWAETQMAISKMTPGKALVAGYKLTNWYKNAPVGGVDSNGKKVYQIKDPTTGQMKYTKEFYDEMLFPELEQMSDLGPIGFKLDDNGKLILFDQETGTVINGGGTSPIGTTGNFMDANGNVNAKDAVAAFKKIYKGTDVTESAMTDYLIKNKGVLPTKEQWENYNKNDRTFDWNSTEDISVAVDLFHENTLLGDITDNAMKQYLAISKGKMPTSEKEWEKFNKESRIYKWGDSEDMSAAYLFAGKDSAYKNLDQGRLKQYLSENGGKLPDADQWNKWVKTAVDPEKINDFINENVKFQDLDRKDQKEYARILAAQDAVNKGTATDEQKILAEKYEKISTKNVNINTKAKLLDGIWNFYGEDFMEITYNGEDEARVEINSEKKKEILNMVGKTINVNGKFYIVNDPPIATEDVEMTYQGYDPPIRKKYVCDALSVIDPETGNKTMISFNEKGKTPT